MSVATTAKRILFRARAIAGRMGLHPHTVELGLTTWSGPYTGDGTPTTTWTPIVERGGQPPKVRWVSDEEIAVGGLAGGSIRIGPITPDFSGGGTSAAILAGAAATTRMTRHVRIIGPAHPAGALYAIKGSDFGSALHYTLTCEPVSALIAAVAEADGDALMDGDDVLTDGDGNPLIVLPGALVDADGNSLTDGSDDLTV